MKILKSTFRVSLVSLLLLANITAGQNKFIENSFPVKNTTHATAIPGGWIVPFNSEDCSRNWIVKYDAFSGANKKFYEADTVGYPSFVISDIIRLPSGAFICGGIAGLGNDVGPYSYPYIYKIKSSGEILWQAAFSVKINDSMGPIYPIKVITAPDGSIYCWTKYSFLGKTDSAGHKLWIKHISGVTDIAWTSKGLTASYNNGLTLLDTAGNVIKVYYRVSISEITGLENGTNGSFYAMNANNIYRLDSTFQVTDSFQFNGYGSGSVTPPIVNYADDSGYYFAHGNSIKTFDLKGNLKWTNYLPSNCTISGLATNGKQLAVTGTTITSGFIKTYDYNGNTEPINRDIKVGHITSLLNKMRSTSSIDGYVISTMDVPIQNTGAEKIDSFYFFSKGPLSSPYYSCTDEYLQAFHNLNLSPGDTTTLHITINRYWSTPNSTSYALSVYLYSSSTNGKLDSDPSNDLSSYSTIVLGIDKNSPDLSSVQIYPNPSTNILHIDNNTGLNTIISVSDITGKEIMSITNPKNEFEIDISGWPTGIYFVKAWNGNGIKVEKLVKE